MLTPGMQPAVLASAGSHVSDVQILPRASCLLQDKPQKPHFHYKHGAQAKAEGTSQLDMLGQADTLQCAAGVPCCLTRDTMPCGVLCWQPQMMPRTCQMAIILPGCCSFMRRPRSCEKDSPMSRYTRVLPADLSDSCYQDPAPLQHWLLAMHWQLPEGAAAVIPKLVL